MCPHNEKLNFYSRISAKSPFFRLNYSKQVDLVSRRPRTYIKTHKNNNFLLKQSSGRIFLLVLLCMDLTYKCPFLTRMSIGT